MPENCFCSDARDSLAKLCIILGTHYNLASKAVDALEILTVEDESILEEATSDWKAIIDLSSDVSEPKIISPEVETPNDRQRVGAMQSLATLSREHPSTAPINTFVSGIREPHPLIRLYASYGLAAVASRKPELTHPHIDTVVEEIGKDLSSLDDVWATPDFSTPAELTDELVQSKLIPTVFNSTLRIDGSDKFQRVVTDVNARLDGDLGLITDKLVGTLPFDPDIWPNYIDLLTEVGDPEPDIYVEQAVCYGLERTCED